MKYLKLFETKRKGKTKLTKLLKYLEDKGLNVKYVYNTYSDYESIHGSTDERPYILFQGNDEDIVIVDYMNNIKSVDPDGSKRGAWKDKEFEIKNYEEIFDFISNLDIMINIKKYNL